MYKSRRRTFHISLNKLALRKFSFYQAGLRRVALEARKAGNGEVAIFFLRWINGI
jgi:hypothetical protein